MLKSSFFFKRKNACRTSKKLTCEQPNSIVPKVAVVERFDCIIFPPTQIFLGAESLALKFRLSAVKL